MWHNLSNKTIYIYTNEACCCFKPVESLGKFISNSIKQTHLKQFLRGFPHQTTQHWQVTWAAGSLMITHSWIIMISSCLFRPHAKQPPSILDVVLTHRGVHVTAVSRTNSGLSWWSFRGLDLHSKQTWTWDHRGLQGIQPFHPVIFPLNIGHPPKRKFIFRCSEANWK